MYTLSKYTVFTCIFHLNTLYILIYYSRKKTLMGIAIYMKIKNKVKSAIFPLWSC
ncbi:hypothetical protein Hanom_Chr15g01408511 [Helianthus anomalus]